VLLQGVVLQGTPLSALFLAGSGMDSHSPLMTALTDELKDHRKMFGSIIETQHQTNLALEALRSQVTVLGVQLRYHDGLAARQAALEQTIDTLRTQVARLAWGSGIVAVVGLAVFTAWVRKLLS